MNCDNFLDDTVTKHKPEIRPHQFREALGHYPTGVVIVTASGDAGGPIGITAGSFMSVSLDPPLVSFTVERASKTLELLRTAGAFCVNVLSADQEDLCHRFATDDKGDFTNVAWHPAPSGAPVLDGVVSWVDCTYDSMIDAGDHRIVIGRVHEVDVSRAALPLLAFQGGYGRFTLPSLVAKPEPDLIQGIRLAECARDQIEMLAEEFAAECSVITPVGEDAVFVALARRSEGASHVSLGSHVPLIPPIGSVFISALGSVAVNAWLNRIPDFDEATRAAYIGQLERVRDRGYSLSLRGEHSDAEMFTAVQEYSSPERLPKHERRFHDIIRATAPLYEPDIEAGCSYDLHSIVMPVPGPLGLVQIALRLANLPSGADGAQVQTWIARLREAVDIVSGYLCCDRPESYASQ